MATFRLPHFSNPRVLRAIAPERLCEFLEPYREFFFQRGYELPNDASQEVDLDVLVSIFMTPNECTPQDLLDALFLVDEMSTPFGMNSLLEVAAEEGYVLEDDEDHSPADIAVQIWLFDRNILERQHARQLSKTFVRGTNRRPCENGWSETSRPGIDTSR